MTTADKKKMILKRSLGYKEEQLAKKIEKKQINLLKILIMPNFERMKTGPTKAYEMKR